MSKPIVVSIDTRESRVYLSKEDIPAESGDECGKASTFGPCDRPVGHAGVHADAGWETRAIVTLDSFSVEIGLCNNYESSPMNFTSYKQWREFIDLVDAEVMDMFRKKEEAK